VCLYVGADHLPLFTCTIQVQLSSGEQLSETIANVAGSKKRVRELATQAMLPLLISRGLHPLGWRG
jgi:hypothetical protein